MRVPCGSETTMASGGQVRPLLQELELRVHGLVLEIPVGIVVVETRHADHLGDPPVHLDPVEQADGAVVVPVRVDLRGAEAVPVLRHHPRGGRFEEAGHAEVVRTGERLIVCGAGACPDRGARRPRRDAERVAVRKRQVRGAPLQQPGMGEGSGHGFRRFPYQGRRREVRVVGISAGGADQGGKGRVVRETVAAGAPDLPLHGDRDRLRPPDRVDGPRKNRCQGGSQKETGGDPRAQAAGDVSEDAGHHRSIPRCPPVSFPDYPRAEV